MHCPWLMFLFSPEWNQSQFLPYVSDKGHNNFRVFSSPLPIWSPSFGLSYLEKRCQSEVLFVLSYCRASNKKKKMQTKNSILLSSTKWKENTALVNNSQEIELYLRGQVGLTRHCIVLSITIIKCRGHWCLLFSEGIY